MSTETAEIEKQVQITIWIVAIVILGLGGIAIFHKQDNIKPVSRKQQVYQPTTTDVDMHPNYDENGNPIFRDDQKRSSYYR